MKVTQLLYNLGLNIWLHKIARDRLSTGTSRAIALCKSAGIDVKALAAQLQDEGAREFVNIFGTSFWE